jgi:hypothetical protein
MLVEERVESPDLVYGDPEPGVDGDHLLAGGQETDDLPAACVPRIKKVKYLALKTEKGLFTVLYRNIAYTVAGPERSCTEF